MLYNRSPLAVGILSAILPGLGYVYSGALSRACSVYIIYVLFSVVLAFIGVLTQFWGMALLTLTFLFLYLFSIFDSVRLAKSAGNYQLKPEFR